jgi:hypothetical protein
MLLVEDGLNMPTIASADWVQGLGFRVHGGADFHGGQTSADKYQKYGFATGTLLAGF